MDISSTNQRNTHDETKNRYVLHLWIMIMPLCMKNRRSNLISIFSFLFFLLIVRTSWCGSKIAVQSGADKRNRKVSVLDFLTSRNFRTVLPAMATCQSIRGFHRHCCQHCQVRWFTQHNNEWLFTISRCFQDSFHIHKMYIPATWRRHLAWAIRISTCPSSTWSHIITMVAWGFHRQECSSSSRHSHISHRLTRCPWHRHLHRCCHNRQQLKPSVHKIIYHHLIHLICPFERHRPIRSPPMWTSTVTSLWARIQR